MYTTSVFAQKFERKKCLTKENVMLINTLKNISQHQKYSDFVEWMNQSIKKFFKEKSLQVSEVYIRSDAHNETEKKQYVSGD